jgi:nicotinamidase-related amidase
MQDFDSARRLYAERGFARRVGWGDRPAILVIDLTNGFTDPDSPVGGDLTDVIKETRRVLDLARSTSLPVMFTSIAYDDPDLEGGYWVKKIPALRVLKMGTDAVQIDPRLGRRVSEPVLFKRFTSAFFGTNLQSLLQSLRIDTLVVCGTSTSGCIRSTACDAVQMGFRCIVPETAVGDRAEAPHLANLFDINAKYADVAPIAEVLEELARFTPKKRA